ncbi:MULTISPECIES: hypothetical protein [Pectobacterium]|uniref:Uncharacterized protein n=1 Tax=Pectobacterium parvum TaxID=2778550 RepID=A0AAP9LAK3_9GAMM|nr:MULTISPECIES: hypothetical protein [Pectobacterium]MBI0427932.1 hypothetical protein [Pectobacterium parmentieri]QHQ22681.1 hypothetical protein GMX10_00095 [Pectobacterium parvum]
MANWWMPVAQLRVMRRIENGGILLRNPTYGFYYWFRSEDPRPTASAKALFNRGLIAIGNTHPHTLGNQIMRITPTGKNELKSNSGRKIEGE